VLRRLARAAVAGLVAASAGSGPGIAAAAPGFDLDALMSLLATRKGGEARFTEERTVGGLDNPLLSSGLLSFQAPDRFSRQTLEPRAEAMEVVGNTMVLRRGGRTRQMMLDTVPELAAMVEAMRGTLTGDGTVLRRHFRTTVRGASAQWTLVLEPVDPRLAGIVRSIDIGGTQADVRSVELMMSGGDRSVMLIEPLRARAP
jgi:hypothetical protein